MAAKIYGVEPTVDYMIHTTFFNGIVRELDIRKNADYVPGYAELVSDRKLFDSVHVNKDRTKVVWENGFTLCMEELYNCGAFIDRIDIDNPSIAFAHRLYNYRNAINMTQKELEKKSGINQADISKFERGEGNPSIKTIDRLAKAMGAKYNIKTGYFEHPFICNVPIFESVARCLPPEKVQGEFTIEDLDDIPEDVRVELINGVIYSMATPTVTHQAIIGEIYYRFVDYIKSNHGSCEPYLSPISLFFADKRFYLEPDMVVVCNLDDVNKKGIQGPPDFVLEVASPGNKGNDYYTKLPLYRDYGVREYWIIDPMKEIMLKFDFELDTPPEFHYLNEEVGVDIYNGQLKIDLREIQEIIDRYR